MKKNLKCLHDLVTFFLKSEFNNQVISPANDFENKSLI